MTPASPKSLPEIRGLRGIRKISRHIINKYVKKSNAIVRSKSTIGSVLGNRLFALVLAQIKTTDADLKTYYVPLPELMQCPTADLGGADYRAINRATDELLASVYVIKMNDSLTNYDKINIFGRAKLENGVIITELHPSMKDYVIDLKRDFTLFDLDCYLRLTAVHSQKMFELLSSWSYLPEKTLALSDLLDVCGIDKNSSMARYSEFKRWVLETSQKNILENTDLKFKFIPIKHGRKFTAIRFIFDEKLFDDCPADTKNEKAMKKIMKCREKNGLSLDSKNITCNNDRCPKYVRKICTTLADSNQIFRDSDLPQLSLKID